MKSRFKPGDRVYWWKRITKQVEFPFQARIVAFGTKRVTILTENPNGGPGQVTRHVAIGCLQPIAKYYEKADNQGPLILEPMASWGKCTIYLEVSEDLWAIRSIQKFENGKILSFDRVHWVDEFGMLADAQINRNRKTGIWGTSIEISAAEFERVWQKARRSSLWIQQKATAKMAQLGAVPIWLTSKGWRPRSRKKKSKG